MKRSRGGWRSAGVACVGLGVLFTSGAATAQSSPEKTAAAQALYDDGMVALDAKDYAKACPKFEEASRLVPEGIGVKLMLAQCYEASGRLASAWTIYRIVESEAARMKQEDRRLKAQKRIEAIEPKLSKLTIEVPPDVAGVAGLRVKRDAIQVGASLFGTAVPIDPGEVLVTATSARGSFEQRVDIGEGQRLSVTIVLGAPKDGSAVFTIPTTTPAAESSSSKGRALDGMAIGGIALGSFGVAVLGVGIGLAVKSVEDESSANDLCPSEQCASREAVDLSDSAHTFNIVGWVGVGVGVAALAGGVALVVISLGRHAAAAEVGAKTSELVVSPEQLTYRLRF